MFHRCLWMIPPPARAELGLTPEQYLILQPTRIIQRKGIEHAIELTRRLGLPAELVISHAAGDEGTDYEKRIREFASLLEVTVNFESTIVGDARGLTPDGRKIYALSDVYPQADLVTYPSSVEGFGNAFLEAVYYKRPLVVNNYSIYEADIKPKGFKVVEFDGYISDATLEHARHLLTHPQEATEYVEQNYKLAQRYYRIPCLNVDSNIFWLIVLERQYENRPVTLHLPTHRGWCRKRISTPRPPDD